MSTKTAWRFRKTDGLYIGPIEVYPNALEPGKWHLPITATFVRPPETVLCGDCLGYWLGNSWSSVPKPEGAEETPLVNILRQAVMTSIDKKTEYLIVSQFVYLGGAVRLSIADQHNFSIQINKIRAWIASGVDEYSLFPLEIKTGSDEVGAPVMLAMGTLAEYTAFEDAAVLWVLGYLKSGWELKRDVATLDLEHLETWKDPRTEAKIDEEA